MGVTSRNTSNQRISAATGGKPSEVVGISPITGRRPKLIVLCGIPGSGKSTWAREYLEEHPGEAIRVNKDEIRLEKYPGREYDRDTMEKNVDGVKRYRLIRALTTGHDAISDDTNIAAGHHRDYEKLGRRFGVDVETIFFDIDKNVAIRRDAERAASVGAEVIHERSKQYWKTKKYLAERAKRSEDMDATST